MTKSDMTTNRIATIGILSALGAVLMLIEIPYPFIPWLTFDISDVVVLVIFVRYGWKDAALVGILKAVVHLLFKGAVGPIAIGQITAFITSMSYVLGMYITTNRLNLNRYLGAGLTVILVTTILTTANYFFITPIYLGGMTYLDVQSWVTPETFGLAAGGGYLTAILIAYVPFNLLKGVLITGSFLAISEVIKRLQ